jgi:hypothetical protein
MEVPVHIDDLFNPVNKLTESARRVIDRALEDSRRREHAVLTSAHLLLLLRKPSGIGLHKRCATRM